MNRSGKLLWAALAGQVVGSFLGLRSLPPRIGIGGTVVALILLMWRRSPLALVCGISLFGFSLGLIDAGHHRTEPGPLSDLARSMPRCDVTGEVLEGAGKLGTIAAVRSLRCLGSPEILNPGAVIMDEPADAGSVFEAEGHLIPLGDDAFDDARRRVGAEVALDVNDIRIGEPERALMRVAAGVRRGMRDAVRDLTPSDGALLRGLTIGDTDGFDEEAEELFRRAGLSHLVAVSGSNVAIVLGAFVLVGRPLGLYLRLILASAGLLVYVLIVGPEPSVVRAGAMGAIGLLALALGSRSAPLNALALALVVVLAYEPALVHSVGLQMSAAATAGIVLWANGLADRFHRVPRVVALAIGVTLAAQIAVAPLVIGVFQQLSLTGPVANLLAAPAVAPATIIGLAAGVVGAVSPSLASLPARAAEPFAWWISEVARRLGGGWAAAQVPAWVGWALLLPVGLAALVTVRRTRTLQR